MRTCDFLRLFGRRMDRPGYDFRQPSSAANGKNCLCAARRRGNGTARRKAMFKLGRLEIVAGARSDRVTALLHFRTQRRDDIVRKFVAPLLSPAEAFLEHGRLLGDELLADGRPIESKELL